MVCQTVSFRNRKRVIIVEKQNDLQEVTLKNGSCVKDTQELCLPFTMVLSHSIDQLLALSHIICLS